MDYNEILSLAEQYQQTGKKVALDLSGWDDIAEKVTRAYEKVYYHEEIYPNLRMEDFEYNAYICCKKHIKRERQHEGEHAHDIYNAILSLHPRLIHHLELKDILRDPPEEEKNISVVRSPLDHNGYGASCITYKNNACHHVNGGIMDMNRYRWWH